MGEIKLAILPVDNAQVAVLGAGIQGSEVSEALHVRRAERERPHGQEMLASRKCNGEAIAGGRGTALRTREVSAVWGTKPPHKARTSSSMMQRELFVACCSMSASSRHSVMKVEEFAQSSALPSRENKRSMSRKDANSAATKQPACASTALTAT